MPRSPIIEIKYKSQSMLPCPERRAGMTDPQAEQRSAEILLQIGRNLRQLHKQNLAVPYPPSSRPGQYPRKRTGSLMRGIYCDPESGNRIAKSRKKSVTIGYGIKDRKPASKRPDLYGIELVTLMNRKGIRNTLAENRTRILAPAKRWKPVEIITIQGG